MANGIHTAVNAMQPPSPHPAVDRILPQPERHQLRVSNDAVLPARKIGDRSVDGVLLNLAAHYTAKSRNPPDSPPQCPSFGRRAARGSARPGRRSVTVVT